MVQKIDKFLVGIVAVVAVVFGVMIGGIIATNGTEEAVNTARDEGYATGWEDGNNEGYFEGYDLGLADGTAEADNEAATSFLDGYDVGWNDAVDAIYN